MAWAVTLIVNDCANSQPLAGALVSDGVGGGYTDTYGQFIAVIDDAYTQYVVQISKVNYSSRAFTFDRSQVGKVQTTCLSIYVAPPPPPPNGPHCFIVTAATGSARSQEVTALRAWRDRVAATAPLAGQLIDAIYEEYWRFSPALADEIRDDDSARMGVLALVVRPLFAWYDLAARLALDPGNADAISSAEEELRGACPRYLGPSKVTSYLTALASGASLPPSAPSLIAELAPRLREAIALPLARWAIFDPLMRTWRSAADGLDPRREVAAWLGAAPLDALPAPSPEQMEREWTALRSLLAFDRNARRQVAQRLRAAWPEAAASLRPDAVDDSL